MSDTRFRAGKQIVDADVPVVDPQADTGPDSESDAYPRRMGEYTDVLEEGVWPVCLFVHF